jgi:hypothetical protein
MSQVYRCVVHGISRPVPNVNPIVRLSECENRKQVQIPPHDDQTFYNAVLRFMPFFLLQQIVKTNEIVESCGVL